MIHLDEFVDGVSVHLGNADASNVPRLAIVFAARQALKRFCDESFAYVVYLMSAATRKGCQIVFIAILT